MARTSSRRSRTRGNAASLALCLAAAVITVSAAVMRAQKDKAAMQPQPADTVSSVPVENDPLPAAEQTLPANADSAPVTDTPAPAAADNAKQTTAKPEDADEWEDSEQTAAIQVLGKNLTYVRPSGGAIVKDYSRSKLVYSKTMDDWRVHNGVDLAANQGETVKSAAEGRVTGITNDPLYGTTVVVNQNDGLMVYYRGLNKDTAVRKGENISAGATLGTVGGIPCESADGVHLHIEVMRDGQFLNPCEALGIK